MALVVGVAQTQHQPGQQEAPGVVKEPFQDGNHHGCQDRPQEQSDG
jgi:hypothetical protein